MEFFSVMKYKVSSKGQSTKWQKGKFCNDGSESLKLLMG